MRPCVETLPTTAGTSPAVVGHVMHGTTLVTNAIIERKGVATALITTKGFRDVLEIGARAPLRHVRPLPRAARDRSCRATALRGRRARAGRRHDLTAGSTTPTVARLVARARRRGRRGRRRLAAARLSRTRSTSSASRDVLRERRPELQVSLSSRGRAGDPRVRAHVDDGRATSTCRPVVDATWPSSSAGSRELGFRGALRIMLSYGRHRHGRDGRALPDAPARVGSGGRRARGGALRSARPAIDELLSFDMGGTTAKAVPDRGRRAADRRREFEVDRVYRFKKASACRSRSPVIEMIEIGAGGGSIARVDALGLLKVGPGQRRRRSGARLLRARRHQPTVTDADLVLGYLDPAYFLGGADDARRRRGPRGDRASASPSRSGSTSLQPRGASIRSSTRTWPTPRASTPSSAARIRARFRSSPSAARGRCTPSASPRSCGARR